MLRGFFGVVMSMLSFGLANGQANGDFRSTNSGNWNNPNNWQRYQGGDWRNPGGTGNNPGLYPGQNTTGTVTISSGHSISVNVSPANNIDALTFVANGANSSVSMNPGFALTVTNAVTFAGPTSNNTSQILAVNAGTVTCGSITMTDPANTNRSQRVTVDNNGVLTVNGNIAAPGAANENFVELSGTAVLNIGGNFTGGNVTFTRSSTSTVRWFGNTTDIRAGNYGNLIIEKPATGASISKVINPAGAVTVQGDFIVESLHATNVVTFSPGANNFTVNGATYLNARGQYTDATNTGTNTFQGPVNIASTGSLSLGANSPVVFQSDINNDGTVSVTTTGLVSFTGSGDKTIGGPGSFTFNLASLTLNTTGASNVYYNASSDLSISGTLTFAADGLLVIGSGVNIRLSAAGAQTITGANAQRYIQLDDSSSDTGQLIKTTNAAVATWRMLYPIGTASGEYTPLDLSSPTAITSNPTGNSTLAIKSIYTPSVIGQLRRTFRLTVSGNTASTTLTGGRFSYNDPVDVSAGDNIANYNTVWFLNSNSGNWTNVTGTAPGPGYFTGPATPQSLSNGTYYYSIGNSTAYPAIWYTYQDGVWSNPNVWTLDPSGTTLVNPLNLYPSLGDQVVILNGYTVTSNVNDLVLATTTIEGGGTLDMAATTGQNLGTVSGAGLLRINGDNLPAGNYASFVTAGTGGTVEYYNTGGTLPTGQTEYNHLRLTNSTNSAITYITAGNLTVNGNLNVTRTGGSGTVTWQINNNAIAKRIITLYGDLTVSAGGLIRAGTGSSGATLTSQHELALYGNLTNEGSIKFFDATAASLSETNYTNGNIYTAGLLGSGVRVTFTGLTNTTVNCNSQTDFYHLVVNKGTGQQAMLTVNSTSVANFRVFGPNNQDLTGTAPNLVSRNNISIINGTLQLAGQINIPTLVVGGSGGIGGGWPIPQSGALWVNSPDVNITVTNNAVADNGRQVYVFGLLRMTEGTITSGYSRGVLGGGAGSIIIEGGTLTTPQLRTTYLGSNNRFAYYQSGGTVNVGTISGASVDQYPRFALPYAECTFVMSGGTINVQNPTSSGISNHGGILIFASSSNVDVSGGTINVTLPATNTNFTITSTAPFYNLNISKAGAANSSAAILNAMSFNDGATFARAAQPLTILGNLTLLTGNTPLMNCNGNDLTVGGNVTVQSGTTLTSGSNTLTFNGSGPQTWTSSGTISTLASATVVVNKPDGVLTLAGANAIPTAGSIGNLMLTSGTLDDGGKTLNVTTSLSNSAVHTGTGMINVNGPATIAGNNGTFGNLRIQPSSTVTLAGTQTITGTLRLFAANSSLNIGSFGLTVLGNIYSNDAAAIAFGNTKRILTNGLRNDGGLTRQATSGADLLFPVGSSAVAYTPVTINVTAATAGLITVRPVVGAHPNVTTASQSVQYYWRVASTGFSGITAVDHKTYTYSTATRNAAGANYRAARYDPVNFTWGHSNAVYNSNAAPGTTIVAVGASPHTFNTATAWTGVSGTRLDGEYTAGNVAAFGPVTVYYSRANTSWGTATTWSNTAVGGPAATDIPCNTCPVVIGDGTINHTVTNSANGQSCGSLVISDGSTLDCSTFTGLNFGTNVNDEGITGRGTLRIGSAVFPSGDFSNFIGPNGGTVEWYGGNKTIPSSGPTHPLNTYYNLIVSPTGTITLPATSLTIYNDLSTGGSGTTATDVTAARTLTINGNINVTSGTFQLSNNTAPTSTTFIVEGNTTINSGASMLVPNASTGNHTLTTNGSIVNNGTMNFFRSTARYLNLVFTGTNDANLTTTGTSTLNLITVDKGNSQVPVLNIDGAGAITTLANNWLTLVNGTVNFNMPARTFVLTSAATTPYTIPASARLRVESGTVNVSNVTNNNSDLLLAGALEVAGGTVNVNSNSANNNNNDIEYASAGSPTIIVSDGSLYVNGSIRRATTTLAGALVYNQSGGTVTIGGRAADNSRGVFEIENNSGSSFTLTGTSVLQVLRPSTTASAFASLYLNPESSNVESTSTIQLGSSTLGNQPLLTMNVVPALGNFTVMGAAANIQTVNMQSSPLSTTGTLTINTASTLNTNSLDVTIGGDLSILGTYNGSNNTTIFNGSVNQAAALSASSTFLNMTINKPANAVTLSGTSPTITNLNILNGTLNVSTLGLTVIGDVINNSSQIGSGSINLDGNRTAQTITSSGGSFTNLTLAGSASVKTVTVVGNLTINGTLNFAAANRFLAIGSNRLTLGTGSLVSGAGNTAFIRTNGVSSDLGVVKNWAVANSSFTYPVGTLSNYTPVQFTLNVTSAGSLTVIPVSSRHPTYNFTSNEQILNYYWIVTRNNSIAYTTTGSHTYAYSSGLMGGAGGALLAGYLDLSNPTGWITTGHGGSATSTLMTYSNQLSTNMPGSSGTYHYTVGTALTLAPAIARVYSRFAGGNWTNINSWTTDASGTGPALSALQFPNGPVGTPVTILSGATIVVDNSSRVSLATDIFGTLDIGTTTGHNFGTITGTGTLRAGTNTFPAGDYAAFVSPTGGTIEYVAPMTMNNRVTYNNLSIAGSGNVTMTNTDIVLNGNLIIAAGATLNNATNNRNISLAGNWSTSGSFTPGTGTVTFNGAGVQELSGATSFYNLVLANVSLTGTGPTTVNNNVTLTSNHLVTSAGHKLSLSATATISGTSATRFIAGPLEKTMSAGSSFTFPIGSLTPLYYREVTLSNTSGADVWNVEYIVRNPPGSGLYPNTTMNPVSIIKSVSMFEYWNISRLGGTAANVTLPYNTGSYFAPGIGVIANLRVARWDGTRWDIPPGGGVHSQSGSDVTGTVTVTNVTAFSPFTLASLDPISPLPVTWVSFTAERADSDVLLNWKTAQERNNDRFEIERSEDGRDFYNVGEVKGAGTTALPTSYSFLDKKVSYSQRHYYRIRQIDFDGKFNYSSVAVIHGIAETNAGPMWVVYPNPVSTGQSLKVARTDFSGENDYVSLVIISSTGRVVMEANGFLDDVNKRLDDITDVIPSGAYVLKITNGVRTEVLRIIRY